MKTTKNYKKTMLACYIGFVTQAIVANFAPLLFLKFNGQYGISLGKIALIPTAFFLTQLVIDLLCAKFVDRIGYRRSILASCLFSAAGLVELAFLPELLPDPFIGILLSVIIYATGSGLIEVLCSPIIEACPFKNKEATMSLLHSFYCWGSLAVVLLSTVFFSIFGTEHWKWLACVWALVPLYNIINFARCPIEPMVAEGEGMRVRSLFRTPLFWVAVVLMVCSGASELSMSQWASAYAESAIGLTKTVGDLAGPCMFALTMGISRVIYGMKGNKIDLTKFMLGSGGLCLVCYLLVSVTRSPVAGLIGCIACGFSVGVMWPGTISISSKRIPLGGTAMFALLAMAGDLGGAFGPGLVGAVTQAAGGSLQKGMLVGCIFPVTLMVALLILKRMKR